MNETRADRLAAPRPAPRRRDALAALWRADDERSSGWGAALVLLVFIPLVYASLLLDGDTFTWLIREEHPIEGLGALSLLAASVACFLLWRRVRGDARWPALRRASLLALALLFFFGFGEEISWGQRLLGLETPQSFQEVNAQHETNVHNLKLFSGALDMDELFQLFWLVMGVIVPVLALWRTPRRRLERLLPILPVALAPLFLLNQALTRGFHELLSTHPELYGSQFSYEHGIFEIKETVSSLLLATGFCLLLLRDRAERDR